MNGGFDKTSELAYNQTSIPAEKSYVPACVKSSRTERQTQS